MGLNLSFDTNIFIYALERSDTLGDKARKVLSQAIAKNNEVNISVLVLEEFFIKVYREKQDEKIPYLTDFITGNGHFGLSDITSEIALKAAQIRAQYSSIRTPDALHLATALETGSGIFITTDKRLPKKVNNLRIKLL